MKNVYQFGHSSNLQIQLSELFHEHNHTVQWRMKKMMADQNHLMEDSLRMLNHRVQTLIAEKGASREVTYSDNVTLEVESTRISEMQPLTVHLSLRQIEIGCGDEYLPSPEYTARSSNELPEGEKQNVLEGERLPIEPANVEHEEAPNMKKPANTTRVWTYFRKGKVPGVVGQMTEVTKERLSGLTQELVSVEKTVGRQSVQEAKFMELAAAKGWADMQTANNTDHISGVCNDRSMATQTKFQRLVQSRLFEMFFGLLIVASTLFVGIQVESMRNSSTSPKSFLAVQILFCCLFAIELFMRIGANWQNILKVDRQWNLFDAICVLLSIYDVVMTGSDVHPSKSNVLVFRMLRVLRFVRAARVMRLARFFRELRLMIQSVMACGVPLMWALCMLTMMIYIFAVFLTVGVQDSLTDSKLSSKVRSDLNTYYGNLGMSMLTLFAGVTGGGDWQNFALPLREVHWVYELVFIAYVAFTLFALLNVVTGIFVDSAMSSAMNDRNTVIQEEMMREGTLVNELKKIFEEADTDGSGVMTQEEMCTYLADQRVQAYMQTLGISVSEARGLFHLLDIDSRGVIDVHEFIMGCLRLKGEAKSIDVATLMYENKKVARSVTSNIQKIRVTLEEFMEHHGRPFQEISQRLPEHSQMIVCDNVARSQDGGEHHKQGPQQALDGMTPERCDQIFI